MGEEYYEYEIDLRRYIEVLLKWWWVIALCGLLAAAAAFLVSYLVPPTYEAEADVAAVRIRTDVKFEPRIDTLSGEELGGGSDRRQALIALVSSSDVARLVLDEIGAQLKPEERDVHGLMGRVEASNEGDLITIKASHPVSGTAASIAGVWAREYVRYINRLYDVTTESEETVASQVEEAKETYEAAQKELEVFLGNNLTAMLEREIAAKQALLNVYQEARNEAQARPVRLEMEALQREIAAKQSLLEVYQVAWKEAQSHPVSLQWNTKRQTLADYYSDLQAIERWLADARALRAQIETGSGSEAATMGNALALIWLRNHAFGGGAAPVELQVDLSDDGIEDVQLEDVDSLIEVLTSRRTETEERINALTTALVEEGPEEVTVTSDNALNARIATLNDEIQALTAELAKEEPSEVTLTSENPLNARISALNDDILAMQAELEAQQARRKELRQNRDNAWETYQALVQKKAEVNVQSKMAGTQVRIASSAVPPRNPVSPRKKMNTALGGVVGLMLGVGAVFVWEWWRQSEEEEEKPGTE